MILREAAQSADSPAAIHASSSGLSLEQIKAAAAEAEVPGVGHADASGFAWHGWYRANRLSVTAHEDSQGTRVQILLDRAAPMVGTLLASQFVIVMTI